MPARSVDFRTKDKVACFRFVDHPSFHEQNANVRYRLDLARPEGPPIALGHLPDDMTRELAMCMHYSAFRLDEAHGSAEKRTWHERYLSARNRIVLGNRKLIFRAVHNTVHDVQMAEDCAGECHLLMLKIVASYNPWLGIRFSTYAFTCLLRELRRLVHRHTKSRAQQSQPYDDALMDPIWEMPEDDPVPEGTEAALNRFLGKDHPLLSSREKLILRQRFGFNSEGTATTLSDIGSTLNLSKERVRQLQKSGLAKLRAELADESSSESLGARGASK